MKPYSQLTREQRYGIYSLLKTGHNQSEIATVLSVHKSTISREIKRNHGQRGYRMRPNQVAGRCQTRWKNPCHLHARMMFLKWAIAGRANQVLTYLENSPDKRDYKIAMNNIRRIESWNCPSACVARVFAFIRYGWLGREIGNSSWQSKAVVEVRATPPKKT